MARRSLKYNAAVLTVTGFLVKAIGFVYRVFIANSIGSEGLGLYQLVVPIYSLLVLVLSSGVSIAVSRFVAEESSRSMNRKGMRIASISAALVMAAGVVVCGVLILNLDSLVIGITGDLRTRNSLFWILALAPPIAAASAYKGYFYGRQEMFPNSIGQILEQISKLVFVLLVFDSFKGQGLENMCLLAVIAMLIGEVVNVVAVYIAFVLKSAKKEEDILQPQESKRATIKKICKTAIPISANRLILSAIGTAESLVIPQRLILFGLTFQESLKAFGRLTGMAAPLVFFPSMLPMALATALVPAIASAVASKQYKVANRQISQSIKLTLIMGLIFTSFFAACSHELAELVYPGKDVGSILNLLAFTGVFLYLQQTMLGILNGLAKESAILLNTLIGSIVRLVIVWFCIPLWGVDAYIYAVIAGSIFTIALNFRVISKLTGMSIDAGEWIIRPFIAALLGSAAAAVLKQLPALLNLSGKIALLCSVSVVLVVILAAFLIMGTVKREDLKRWTGRSSVITYDIL
jgi:stage V sporulation protein B